MKSIGICVQHRNNKCVYSFLVNCLMSSRTQILFNVNLFGWSTCSLLLRIRLNSDHQLCQTVQKWSGRHRRNIHIAWCNVRKYQVVPDPLSTVHNVRNNDS